MNAERGIEKDECNGALPCVGNGNNLKILETIKNTPQLPQAQYDLQQQLRELRIMANKLGLYDAADFLCSYCG